MATKARFKTKSKLPGTGKRKGISMRLIKNLKKIGQTRTFELIVRAVALGTLYFLCLNIHRLIELFPIKSSSEIFTYDDGFMAIHNRGFPEGFSASSTNCSREVCHKLCMMDSRCKVYVSSELVEAEGNCSQFHSTPYRFGSKVFDKKGSSVHLKISELKQGVPERDDMLYYFGPRPMTLDDAVLYCEKDSDFYHLAFMSNETQADSVASNFINKNEQMSPKLHLDDTVGVFVEFIDLHTNEVENHLIGDKLPLFKSPGDGIGTLHSVYLYYYSNTRSYVGSQASVKGYPLCQGDPWNFRGFHDMRKRVGETEKLDRKQAVQKYLRGGDHMIIYMID